MTVGLRIGVNTGRSSQVVEGRGGGERIVTGDAVNVAARLRQLAEPGQVLVGARTRAATVRAISYGERGPLVARRQDAARAKAWPALRRNAAARQPPGSRLGRAGSSGRDDELALLRLAAARVARGALRSS